MPDLTLTTFDFDTMTGLSRTAKPIAHPLPSLLRDYFADTAAYGASLAKIDPMVCVQVDIGVPESSGNVAHGTTLIKHGKIGTEHYMTKGQFHTLLDTAEVDFCLSGHGGMMMETPEGKVDWREMRQGDVVHLSGRRVYRSINISATEPFMMLFAFPCHAGHDYGTIAAKGLRKLIVDKGGVPTMADNPCRKG